MAAQESLHTEADDTIRHPLVTHARLVAQLHNVQHDGFPDVVALVHRVEAHPHRDARPSPHDALEDESGRLVAYIFVQVARHGRRTEAALVDEVAIDPCHFLAFASAPYCLFLCDVLRLVARDEMLNDFPSCAGAKCALSVQLDMSGLRCGRLNVDLAVRA